MSSSLKIVVRSIRRLRLPHKVLFGVLSLTLISCAYAPKPKGGIENYPGWPMASQAQGRSGIGQTPRPVRKVVHTPPRGPFPPLKVDLPEIPDAEYIREDDLCMTCHETHVTLFKEKNVHRQFSCEECHGPGSEHLLTRGQEEGKILNVSRLSPPQRSEICLRCHEKEVVPVHVAEWRTSLHANQGVSCSDCHRAHHDLPEGTPAVTPPVEEGSRPIDERLVGTPSVTKQDEGIRRVGANVASNANSTRLVQDDAGEEGDKLPSLRGTSLSLGAERSDVCFKCHEGSFRMLELVGPHRVGTETGFKCTTCHDSQGTLTMQTGKETCLNCHSGPLSTEWHSSTHNAAEMKCIDCHNPHPSLSPQASANLASGIVAGLPRPMAVVQVDVCVRCHEQTKQLVEIADPHQVGGRNNFLCTTCHNPHGQLSEYSRQDLCLTCHNDTPTAAWHSSIHNLQGIKCTDCHDPHPDSRVQEHLDIRHTNIRRPNRLPMSVNDPDTCYKCHPQIVGLTQLPSHHPIFEGKMNCSSCHNSHGEALRLLNEPTVNLVCYKCHSEVQGPFVYEHPPATQDCTICHNPHGAVENNLLHQPATFLCLRCHSGHRTGPPFHDSSLLPDIGKSASLQKAFFSDCTQCHSQVHGSDVPSPNNPGVLAR